MCLVKYLKLFLFLESKKMIKNFFKKEELKILWPFYCVEFFTTIFLLTSAFEIIYFVDIGFSLTQVGFILGSMFLANFLFEIPTGAVADVFGRKISTLIGVLLEGIFVTMVFFTTSFSHILALYFLIGLSFTFVSGAEEAWIVDLLRKKKRKDLIDEYFTKSYSFDAAGMFLSGIVGALVVSKFGLSSIWIVAGIATLSAIPFYLIPKEGYKRKNVNLSEPIKETINQTKKSIRYCRRNKLVLLIIMAGLFANFGYFFGHNLTWFPLLESQGLNEAYFGYLFSGMFLIGIFSPYISKKIQKKIGKYATYLLLILSFIGLIAFLTWFVNSLVGLMALYILFMSGWDFYGPIRPIFFQKVIPSNMRATISSIYSMVRALILFSAPPLVGFIAENIGIKNTIAISTIVLIPAIVLYAKMKEKKDI